MSGWADISTAPKDRWIRGRATRVDLATGKLRYQIRKTLWCKTSHISWYGWNYLGRDRDIENLNIWHPTHWQPLSEPAVRS